jgi:hypothetical protein
VRATLLHGALGVRVDSSESPVAALLIVCDELCDWQPTRHSRNSTSDRARSINDRTIVAAPKRGRASQVGIAGLWFQGKDGPLRSGLDPGKRMDEEGPTALRKWPEVVVRLHSPRDLDGAAFEIWLRTAQNVGRIHSNGAGWGPTFTLVNEVPGRLKALQHTTPSLLAEISARSRGVIRGRLQRWLESATLSADDKTESVCAGELSRQFTPDDIAYYMPELLDTALEVIEELERIA